MAFADLVAATDRAVQDHLGGAAVVYQPEAGGSYEITGMFDENYVLVQANEFGAEQVGPSVFLDAAAVAELPMDPADDAPTLVIGGVTYAVRERQPDGIAGGIRLHLHRAGA